MARRRRPHYPSIDHDDSFFPPHNLLVFEGNEEFHSFRALFSKSGILGHFHFEPCGGYESLWKDISVQLAQSELERIGIIVDADNDPKGRWDSLRDRLMDECGYKTIPPIPESQGTVVHEPGKPILGVWMMPDNGSPGALEEFLRFLIPSDDILWPYALEVVAGLPPLPYPSEEGRSNSEAKARIHSWLAWQEQCGQPIGLAITKGFLRTQATEVGVFVDWLKRLFEIA